MEQDLVAPGQSPGRKFPDNNRVRPDLPRVQQGLKMGIGLVKMINPNGGVDQHSHRRRAGLRRGEAEALRSLPPKAASRAAASRWMSARNPSWITAVFSVRPA
jgi:hypothetical protein